MSTETMLTHIKKCPEYPEYAATTPTTKLHYDFALCPSVDNLQKYENGKWRDIPAEDRLKLTKMDAQVWISLLNLLLKPDCQRKYDFNNFNKNQLLKVQRAGTEVPKPLSSAC